MKEIPPVNSLPLLTHMTVHTHSDNVAVAFTQLVVEQLIDYIA